MHCSLCFSYKEYSDSCFSINGLNACTFTILSTISPVTIDNYTLWRKFNLLFAYLCFKINNNFYQPNVSHLLTALIQLCFVKTGEMIIYYNYYHPLFCHESLLRTATLFRYLNISPETSCSNSLLGNSCV